MDKKVSNWNVYYNLNVLVSLENLMQHFSFSGEIQKGILWKFYSKKKEELWKIFKREL